MSFFVSSFIILRHASKYIGLSANPLLYIPNNILYYRDYGSKIQNKYKDTGFDANKAKLILQMHFTSPDDALPFYKLPMKTLLHIYKSIKRDEELKFCKNRLYYIAEKIKQPSYEVSRCVARRYFVYSLSFEWIEKSLNVLLEMNVSGDRILRDLWVLKYYHETIRERLQTVKDAGVDNLYPWMVRCDEDILNRYISYCQESKSILGDVKSTHTYLANRLNISPHDVNRICFKVPALKAIRVTKVKHFLDFLEKEGFEVNDIANKPRILSSSPKTVEERLNKLRKLGLKDINLNVLCRSRKAFQKYYESIESVMDKSESDTSKECL